MSKYPYTVLPTKTSVVYKPLVPVRLHYSKTHKMTSPIIALVDSGADACFCSENIGFWLGIKFDKKKKHTFTAANNQTFETFKEVITLEASGKKYSCPFYFTNTLPRQTPIILGQIGFFNHFKITFHLENKEIEIT